MKREVDDLIEIRKRFANNLKNYRRSRRYTQNMLSDKLGIKRAALASYEENRAFPNPKVLCGLSRLSNTPVDAFLNIHIMWKEI